MSDCIGTWVKQPAKGERWTQGFLAENFCWGVGVGEEAFGECGHYGVQNDAYGPATGFVYFLALGEPITHVKVGYTTGDPRKRRRALQTANPFKLTLLGFVLGNVDYERELHNVLHADRAEGEWFNFTPRVQQVIVSELENDYL